METFQSLFENVESSFGPLKHFETFQALLKINVATAVTSAFCVTGHTCNFPQKLNSIQYNALCYLYNSLLQSEKCACVHVKVKKVFACNLEQHLWNMGNIYFVLLATLI